MSLFKIQSCKFNRSKIQRKNHTSQKLDDLSHKIKESNIIYPNYPLVFAEKKSKNLEIFEKHEDLETQ